MKGNEDERTLGQPRMREFQPRFIDFKIAYLQNIQIQRAGPIWNRCQTITTELLFDFQKFLEQIGRLEFCFQRCNRIHKPRLLRESNRLSAIKR